jgi:Tfp pilus assembly protein PilN
LGYSNKGKLCALCNFWAGYNDLTGDKEQIINEAVTLSKSISPPDQHAPIMVYCPKNSFSIPDSMKNTSQVFLDPPVVPGLSLDSHEAYALALHEDIHLDFADFNQVQHARTLMASRKRSLTILRTFSSILLIAALALMGLKGVGTVSEKYLNRKMEPVRKYIEQYKTEQGRLDALTGEMKKKTQFVSQKSQITNALTEMQTAFPEGVWTEQISFTESASGWTIAIVAFSNSNASIPVLLKNIAGIKGMTGVRMVYSEQTSIRDKTGEKAIKFRLEGEWGR